MILTSINSIIYAQNETFVIENFEDETIDSLPKGWYNMRGEAQPYTYTGENRAAYKYSIQEEDGNKFLRYEGVIAKHLNFPLIDKEGVNIKETPILSWKWRVYDIPEGGNEDSKDRNDVAVSIYVVFEMNRVALIKKVPRSIRYTWSSTLSEGAQYSKLFGNQRIIVVESGKENLGEWITFERNIVQDYKDLFGGNPPSQPIAILILSDGDDTRSYIKADYDDIILKKEKPETDLK
ncbi:DUF3047 domain-containing protein [Gracilimonas halophila]|uniref:DUF3047 domain-containing protein n=1 Tax=Gracilimonas halophila TaxID=1834464 RepID=A0ABW5JMJ4_9BACT